jgi:uncharacterized membrane protein HdeD (DUF308 family)
MAKILALNWWTLAVRGIVAVVLGLVALFVPLVTLVALTALFGAYSLIDGVVSLIAAVRAARHGEHWWELGLEGIAGLAAAAVTLAWPAVTLVFLIYLIAIWAVITGVMEILAAVRLRRHIQGEWLLILAGVASVAFGVLLLAAPGPGALVLAWWMGAYITVFGVLMLGLAFRLRRWSTGTLHPQHV